MQAMNLPNILNVDKSPADPIFVILIINKYFDGSSHFLRCRDHRWIDGPHRTPDGPATELGAYLDPIADKLLAFAAFISLAIIEMIPSWLVVIVITRDIIILVGFLVMFLTNYHPKINPSFLEQDDDDFSDYHHPLCFIGRALPVFKQLSILTYYVTGIITILSGIQYVYIGTRILNEKK